MCKPVALDARAYCDGVYMREVGREVNFLPRSPTAPPTGAAEMPPRSVSYFAAFGRYLALICRLGSWVLALEERKVEMQP